MTAEEMAKETEELKKVFELVQHPEHWKYPHSVLFYDKEHTNDAFLAKLEHAIVFFFGGDPGTRIKRLKNGSARVSHNGYQAW